MNKGFFITFEGPDGAGKSTQIDKLKLFFAERNLDVLYTREPGGTDIGEKIRQLILDKENVEMDPVTEAFLYASARAQLVRQVLKPAIAAGKIIVCDRYIDSSTAYQGYARGLGESVAEINKHAVGEFLPDLTFLFILDPEIGKSRIAVESYDRLESQNFDFHRKVAEGYIEIAKNDDNRFVIIDATKTVDEIWKEIQTVLVDKLGI